MMGGITVLDSFTSESLDTALAAARRRYVDANPASAAWAARAVEVLPGGNTRSVLHFDPFPFRVASADAQNLVDVDGHRYVDLLGNYPAGLLGHSPEPVRTAAHAAIDGGWALGAVHPNEVRLAELIVGRFPSIEQVRFTNSGTEANLMALAVATNHTGRTNVLVFDGGYHGGVITFGAAREVNVPHDWIVSTYNDISAVDSVFAAQQSLGITPDLTTLGKDLAGGFTFGAFGGRRDLMAAFDTSSGGRLGHAGTFNNNVVSMAAGVAALTEVLTPEVLVTTNARGERLRSELHGTFARHGVPMCVSGSGSLMNVHGVSGPITSVDDLHSADDRCKELFFFDSLHAGFYLARRGFIALSIEITDDDVDAFVEFVDQWAATITSRVRTLM